MKLPTLLIIGLVWPEQRSSAAGKRIMQLVELFLENRYRIVFASAAIPTEHSADLDSIAVASQRIMLNSETFDEVVRELNPNIVLFDRFAIEEQYGWRVAENCPNAMRILDTEDLHCLRVGRAKALKFCNPFSECDLLTEPMAKREIASILRCDLSLIISEVELELLQRLFRVDPALLFYIPLFAEQNLQIVPFEDRQDFLFIGNFLHAPNLDAVRQLKNVIWPELGKLVPNAKLKVCGAYPSQEVMQMHDEKSGFLVEGRVPDALSRIGSAKILLAPLRIGAGIKGKLLEAISAGTPSVTSSVGAEGISGEFEWMGTVSNDTSQFAMAAANLYTDKNSWQNALKSRFDILKRFNKADFTDNLLQEISRIRQNLPHHRSNNFLGNLLQHHTNASTKYMSLWIEEKNRK